MTIQQRPSMKAVPIDRSGPPACRTTLHRHCARCGASDQTVASTVTRDGVEWPPMCAYCSAKVRRLSGLLAMEACE